MGRFSFNVARQGLGAKERLPVFSAMFFLQLIPCRGAASLNNRSERAIKSFVIGRNNCPSRPMCLNPAARTFSAVGDVQQRDRDRGGDCFGHAVHGVWYRSEIGIHA
jgi:hypothetical protein